MKSYYFPYCKKITQQENRKSLPFSISRKKYNPRQSVVDRASSIELAEFVEACPWKQILRWATRVESCRCLRPRSWNLGYLEILRTTRRTSFSTLYIRKYVENGWEKGDGRGSRLPLEERERSLGNARVKNWKDRQHRERERDFHRNLFIEFESFLGVSWIVYHPSFERGGRSARRRGSLRSETVAKQVRDGIKCIARVGPNLSVDSNLSWVFGRVGEMLFEILVNTFAKE